MDGCFRRKLFCERDRNHSLTSMGSQPLIAGILTLGQKVLDNGCSIMICGFNSKLASAMENSLQAKGQDLIFKIPEEHEGGRRLENGTWTGMVKDLINGAIDFSLESMMYDQDRIGKMAATPTYPWAGGYQTNILYKEQMADVDPVQIFMIFDAWSWGLFIASFILVPLDNEN